MLFYSKKNYLGCKNYVDNCEICRNVRGRTKIKQKFKQTFPNVPLDRIVADRWELPEHLKKNTLYLVVRYNRLF